MNLHWERPDDEQANEWPVDIERPDAYNEQINEFDSSKAPENNQPTLFPTPEAFLKLNLVSLSLDWVNLSLGKLNVPTKDWSERGKEFRLKFA